MCVVTIAKENALTWDEKKNLIHVEAGNEVTPGREGEDGYSGVGHGMCLHSLWWDVQLLDS